MTTAREQIATADEDPYQEQRHQLETLGKSELLAARKAAAKDLYEALLVQPGAETVEEPVEYPKLDTVQITIPERGITLKVTSKTHLAFRDGKEYSVTISPTDNNTVEDLEGSKSIDTQIFPFKENHSLRDMQTVVEDTILMTALKAEL